MLYFFSGRDQRVFVVAHQNSLETADLPKLAWLFGNASIIKEEVVVGTFVGPRVEMITPWSTNAVEITQNMGIDGIVRIEEFFKTEDNNPSFDPMLQQKYESLTQDTFKIERTPEKVLFIDDISAYNESEGLALSDDEIKYLENLSNEIDRKLTDSEIFGFSQVNSEHCRHKIFNGRFIIDGEEKEVSLFKLIKRTSETHPNTIVSAYKDNCAFIEGPEIEMFVPSRQDTSEYFTKYDAQSVISLKAETHNFPTTVEPFNGAATGAGGEIRDRIAGGKTSFPIAGTAVYMTAYPRTNDNLRPWEKNIAERAWLYQRPDDILIKASNGASDFGNKFGQPLICGSVFTFEHEELDETQSFDKVIMLAGGIGYGKKVDALKDTPNSGDKVVLLGGDNYRIGMGGGAVSSVATGEYANKIELNAIQRSNPEMQKRAYNAIRAMSENGDNPIVSIHDHGAGGHLNCLSELVEETGGKINIDELPIGDPTLSSKEIVGNESQERMGLVIQEKDIETLNKVAERERAPMYVIGETTGNMQFTFHSEDRSETPIDLQLAHMFGDPPKTTLNDTTKTKQYGEIKFDAAELQKHIENVLQLEAVACKDWLTNKVDRSVTGKIAKQQTAGEMQLPLNNLGVTALDYKNKSGIATSIGHAPSIGLIDPAKGSVISITEALTNIIWAPLKEGIQSISLSANWMWPCKIDGEDARLYNAVEAASEYAIALGINIPTGKDSLSMTQKYPDGQKVFAPGTVIISAVGEVTDITQTIEPVIKPNEETEILYIDLSGEKPVLGGSSLAQTLNQLGNEAPGIQDPKYVVTVFNTIQELIKGNHILAGHDISSGGLITSILEMTFPNLNTGIDLCLDTNQLIETLFNEAPGLLIQVEKHGLVYETLKKENISFDIVGKPNMNDEITLVNKEDCFVFNKKQLRDTWFKSSYILDRKQSGDKLAHDRFSNYKNQPLKHIFPKAFQGSFEQYGIDPNRKTTSGIKAAIIREKGVNGDREMAHTLHLAGFDVKDVHMTDLISGRETLEDIKFIVFVGGFSNSDVLGSAKGWAGAFLYNEKAKKALDNFYARADTLSLGVCNGCQLMMELGLVHKPCSEDAKPFMDHNATHKFESAFLTVTIPENNSVMMKSLTGSKLGVWIAHGEGQFILPEHETAYHIPLKYEYEAYPGNPNGSAYSTAALCSADGRHLAMMPHPERTIMPWNWAHYPEGRNSDQISPWIEAFVNAREWVSYNT